MDALSLSEEQRLRVQALGLDFLAGFLEVELERHPANVEALAELGHVYTRQGRIRQGLAVDQRLVQLVPRNPTVHYNLACSLAILGELPGALDALEEAVRLGYDDADFLRRDDDLANLRAEPRFRTLLTRLEARSRG